VSVEDRFDYLPGDNEDESCARCGSSTGWIECWACNDGLTYIDTEDDFERFVCATCEWCDGKGGHDVCLSSIEWCTANPLPGCEEVGRT
jgi:hypothetical protein